MDGGDSPCCVGPVDVPSLKDLMSLESFYQKYRELMVIDFPDALNLLPSSQLPYLISPFVLELPGGVFDQAQSTVKTIYKISHEYQNQIIKEPLDTFCPPRSKNSSVLMAYDFHLVHNDLKLIEINTNASGFLLADLSQRAHGFDSSLPSLQLSFSEEMGAAKSVSIIDKDPWEQKMYVEFLMYQNWFESLGIDTRINDFRELRWEGRHLLSGDQSIDFVYNRYCDFLLGEEVSRDLSLAYKSGHVIFSPQPREYILLADKQRLIDWVKPVFQSQLKADEKKVLQKVLIPSWEARAFGSDKELWDCRKKLFFKPKNSYGSRSTYRGKSISKKNFERVIRENFLVQDFTPPGQVSFNGGDPWKYDLRFYAFRDQIQLSMARIYRGQLTNFNKIYGGFTSIRFK